ncbi:hypothetical protein TSUD_182860 [Trifolium subterraneum]|uniref:RING-type domain-containing protein n=1 Tax=Trifolium subterraneum TaxID=3900 RepID=A0A2Z6LK58_TRISU|nr:hypothetical protein TSUD_182860 [Trifolium subterraneum]
MCSVTCILRWATYNQKVTCPQCKLPFEFLTVHRTLDGSIQDYMVEESVCLLLRAKWFEPLPVVEERAIEEDIYFEEIEDYYYQYEEADDDLDDEVYYGGGSASVRIGNRRWERQRLCKGWASRSTASPSTKFPGFRRSKLITRAKEERARGVKTYDGETGEEGTEKGSC